MTRILTRSAWLLALALSHVAHAAVDHSALKGQSLIPSTGARSLAVANKAELGAATPVTAGAEGPDTLRLETLAEAANPWDVQASVKTTAAVAKDDVILASFWIRSLSSRLESGEAETQFVFELARDPWDKSADYPVRAGKEWRLIHVPFQSKAAYAAGEAQVIFRLGYRPQAFEVRGLTVLNYGSQVGLKDLPVTKVSYQGREADAPWRAAAEARIQAHRMAPLSVRVSDAQGRPVAGAKVSLRQTRNAFLFGSAMSSHFLFKARSEGRQRYESEFVRLFNSAVEENAFKWPAQAGDWGPEWGLGLALDGARWAKERGLAFRGHVLYWPSWRNTPKSLRALATDRAALHREVFDHIRGTASAAKGLMTHWDVVNEPFDNDELTEILGPGSLGEAFREARQADPKAVLYINDYAILAGGGGDTPHRRHYEQTIESLLRSGAPLQGIGMQGHFGWNLTGMDDALQILDRYAKLLPRLCITEYDIAVDDFELAGDYTRDILTLVYSHPAAEGFLMWGFWDGAHWHKNAPLYRADWTPKPALAHWEELVLKRWRTQAEGVTDAQGAFSLRGHKGDYEVRVEAGGKAVTQKLSVLKAEGAELQLKLK